VNHAETSAGSLPIVVAEQQGLLARQGLTLERSSFAGGGPAVQALAGGSIDVCICAGDHALRLQERGLGGKIFVALGERNLYAVMAPAGSAANDLAGLKGQQVGVTSAGGLADNSLRWAIRQEGLDPDTDFSIIAAGTGGTMRAAVENGAVAAGTFTTPDIQSNQALGNVYKIVYDFRPIPYAAQGLVALDGWLEANPETARKLASAVRQALALIQEKPEVLDAAVKEMFASFDDDMVKRVSADVRTAFLSKDGVVGREAYDNMVATVTPPGAAGSAVPYDQVVTTGFLPAN
jgi:NitT/TauT family transport system substrate-binding protein